MLIKQTGHTTYQSLICSIIWDTSGHYTLQQGHCRPVLLWFACCYSLFPTYGKLSNAWTEIAIVFTPFSLKSDL